MTAFKDNFPLICTLILITPLLSALLIARFFRRKHKIATFISVAAAFTLMVFSLWVLFKWQGDPFHTSLPWLVLGDFTLSIGYYFDHQTALMLAVVTVIGFLIHVFSIGYMDDDDSRARFFAGLSIFMFSMLGIVLADNLFMLFIFWELVGFSSYALIAHYAGLDYAAMASKKAFIVNRVGDFAFLAGIIACYWNFGTVDILTLSTIVHADPQLISTTIGLLLICGFIGKSAQFPLHVWLPDAMAGPTPVSALIHAATMVAAGIYMVARIIFLLPVEVLNVIACLGAAMTVFAGLCALGQSDIKKILAYSTLSQLGYMATALGMGYAGLALFHLATHACFKALLFLAAGSIIHALHHEQDIFKMGGLLKRMPVTSLTFMAGLIALCGVNFTSGFFSKDAIIEAAYLSNKGIFVAIYFAAFLTACYMGRLLWITFFGHTKSKSAEIAKESSLVMTVPLIILAIFALVAGYTTLWPNTWSPAFLPEYKAISNAIHEAGASTMLLIMTTSAWMLGLVLTYLYYKPGTVKDPLESQVRPLFRVFQKKFYFDEVYNFFVAKVQQRFADALAFLDLVLISGLFVRGAAGFTGLVGIFTKTLHTGNLHGYVYWFLFGILIYLFFAIY